MVEVIGGFSESTTFYIAVSDNHLQDVDIYHTLVT